ncbi:hypothetical protein AMC90_CH01782 [Rhizobium phaseoli]|uniref:hypothetical protein n=1 Tax=Rhizobium phaseoli TaxID=396 RepID=UPI0007F16D09|nr:hypothetical protein [Rhizobium phaseoli]ANL27620.1 hypothetical protein AMC90_CH01782 [Rhizobium phaseoli]
MQKRNDGLGGVDEALFLAIDEAVDQAARAGRAELQSAGFRTSPHEYFSDAALRHLFMRLCRADVRTYKGGDPDVFGKSSMPAATSPADGKWIRSG